MVELTERQRAILSMIVDEYIRSAVPVASKTIVEKWLLGISPATVRNEMMELEEAGYIYQPHISAGRVPSVKGYRSFVEAILQGAQLSGDEQRMISHQFHQIEPDVEEWSRLAASILAHLANSAAMVTTPHSPACRLKHLELILMQDGVALMVVVLQEGTVRQQMISVPKGVTEDDLSAAAHKLTYLLKDMSAARIETYTADLSTLEKQVREALVRLMEHLDARRYYDLVLDGLSLMLRQPEFVGSRRTYEVFEALQTRQAIASILPKVVAAEDVVVLIGEETDSPPLHECAVVVARYGVQGEVGGMLGVVGPTRLQYTRAIPGVRYLARVMSNLLGELLA